MKISIVKIIDNVFEKNDDDEGGLFPLRTSIRKGITSSKKGCFFFVTVVGVVGIRCKIALVPYVQKYIKHTGR